MWRDRRVVVTGASGLVGKHLVRRLARDEHSDVLCVVRDMTPEVRRSDKMDVMDFNGEPMLGLGHYPQVSVAVGDVTDLAFMRRVLVEHQATAVFHLAAQTIVPIANTDPWSTWESNVRGTYTVLEAVRLSAPRASVVVASTDKAYGEQKILPTDEGSRLDAVFPYDVSKACADMVVRSYRRTFGLQAVVTRCGNIFGEGDLNWNRLVPGTVRSATYDERPQIRSDGTLLRDYIYVGDVVDAYLHIAECIPLDTRDTHAFNISDDRPLTVIQMVQAVLDYCGKPELEPIVGNEPVKEIPRQYLTSRLLRSYGWEPKFGFDEGLRRTVDWYRRKILWG